MNNIRVHCIIPAAGESTRFPWNKLLYVYHDKPIIIQTISNIEKSSVVDEIVVITGFQYKELTKTIKDHGLDVDIVYNPEYRSGMSNSVKKGVKYILEEKTIPDGIMINPGDAAWIEPGIYTLVVTKFSEYSDRYDIAISSYHGKTGHPVIFSNKLTRELLEISEEKQGLKEVIHRHRYSVLKVETEYPGVLLDLDTILDLLRIKNSVYK